MRSKLKERIERLERIRNERDDACELLLAFDPRDAATVAKILDKFLPGSEPDAAAEPST